MTDNYYKYTFSIRINHLNYEIGFNHDTTMLYYCIDSGQRHVAMLESKAPETLARELLVEYIRDQGILIS